MYKRQNGCGARPGTPDGSAARRSRLPAARASAALRVSCTSRCLLDVRSGLWPSGLHTCTVHTAHCTPALASQGSSCAMRPCNGPCAGSFLCGEWYVINSFLFWTKLAGSERSERRAPCSLSVESMRTSHQVSLACARTSPDEPADTVRPHCVRFRAPVSHGSRAQGVHPVGAA